MVRPRREDADQLSILDARVKTAPCVPAIRLEVAQWRSKGYKGITKTTRTLLTHWFSPRDIPVKMSIWNTSHSIGAGLIVILCGYLATKNWRLCFFVPAGLAALCAVFLWFTIPDTPTSVGLPEVEGTRHSLAGVYRLRVLQTVKEMLEQGKLRFSSLLDRVRTRFVDAASLRDVDPELRSLWNLNTPADYEAALRELDF